MPTKLQQPKRRTKRDLPAALKAPASPSELPRKGKPVKSWPPKTLEKPEKPVFKLQVPPGVTSEIEIVSDNEVKVYPCKLSPPEGLIITRPLSEYSNGGHIYIDDGASVATGTREVDFYVKTDPADVTLDEPTANRYVVDLTHGVTAVTHVGQAIVQRVNDAAKDGKLFLHARMEPTDGRVYLSYDFASAPTADGNAVGLRTVSLPVGATANWTKGGPTNDVRDLQWAIEHVAPNGRVVLMPHANGETSHSSFQFGKVGRLRVERDVRLHGQYGMAAGLAAKVSGSAGAGPGAPTIDGGTQLAIGETTRVSYSIRDIVFRAFRFGAIRVTKSQGVCDISDCTFEDFFKGAAKTAAAPNKVNQGVYPIVVDGGKSLAAATDCGGTLRVRRNLFGAPPAASKNDLNNLMHFSNCNLELEITKNTVEDCTWGGFFVFGNMGASTIMHNTIRKTRSYKDGAGIAIGALSPSYYSPDLYTGRCLVSHNHITIESPNSSAILIANYPRDLKQPVEHVVEHNVITMTGGKAAMGCKGVCSGTLWGHNSVAGEARVGIWVSPTLPPSQQQLPTGNTLRPSGNKFEKNDLKGFTGTLAQVLIEQADSSTFFANDLGPVGFNERVHRGLAGLYVRDSAQNVFWMETFHGVYPGMIGSDPVPCVWLARASDNIVLMGPASPGPDVCTQAFCSPVDGNHVLGPSARKTIAYSDCPAPSAATMDLMAQKETQAAAALAALGAD